MQYPVVKMIANNHLATVNQFGPTGLVQSRDSGTRDVRELPEQTALASDRQNTIVPGVRNYHGAILTDLNVTGKVQAKT